MFFGVDCIALCSPHCPRGNLGCAVCAVCAVPTVHGGIGAQEGRMRREKGATTFESPLISAVARQFFDQRRANFSPWPRQRRRSAGFAHGHRVGALSKLAASLAVTKSR